MCVLYRTTFVKPILLTVNFSVLCDCLDVNKQWLEGSCFVEYGMSPDLL